ncbi:MAG: site-2 protease family protein [archaeon]
MNIDTISIIVFYSVLLLLFIKYKKKFTMQGIIALYKTKLGLKLMGRIARLSPRLLNILATTGVIAGFIGMIFGFVFLIKETLKFLVIPETITPLIPLLPGITIPGVPTLTFWHWIIAIFIAAVLHEFSHGLIARLHNIPIKSSGFAFLGPILAAFVEPDETIMNRKKPMQQLGVLAAGPFSNILTGIVFFLIFNFLTAPLFMESFAPNGITVNTLIEDSPAYKANLEVPFKLLKLNDQETISATQFVNTTKNINPGDVVKLETDKGSFELTATQHPENKSLGFVGISGFEQELIPAGKAEGRPWLLGIFSWINLLAMWLFVINIGIAIFNLLPFVPADGGKMSLIALQGIFPTKGKTIWRVIQITTISLIVINLLPWVFKLLAWIFNMFVFVITLGL